MELANGDKSRIKALLFNVSSNWFIYLNNYQKAVLEA